MLFKELLVCRSITCQKSIMSQAFYPITISKTLLTNNVSSKNLSFIVLYQTKYR